MSDMRYYASKYRMPDYGFSPDAEFPLINIEKGGVNALLIRDCEGEADADIPVLSIHAGKRPNVVPAYAEAVVDYRKVGFDRINAQIEEIAKENNWQLRAKDLGDGTACISADGILSHGSLPENGLNACVVHPSGIVGPEDYNLGSISSMIISYCRGRPPLGVEGGYDFVDVRDVASGILACCEKGVPGECYILSSEYVSIRTLLGRLQAESRGKRVLAFVPTVLAKILSPFAEGFSLLRREKPCFTPYSVAVLASNGHFSHAKATHDLGYSPRKFADTLRDTFRWLREKGYC